jgi:hypothetical protein
MNAHQHLASSRSQMETLRTAAPPTPTRSFVHALIQSFGCTSPSMFCQFPMWSETIG